jgi:inner membrane protein
MILSRISGDYLSLLESLHLAQTPSVACAIFPGYDGSVDSLTHTLAGAVVARAIGDEKVGNWGAIAGVASGVFPDLDFVLGFFNRQYYLQYHRDFTHSILLIPFYSLLFAWVFVKVSKRACFSTFYKVCLCVLLSHVVLDLLTSYGTMVFSPLWNHRFSWDLVFIIDLVISAVIFFPLLASFVWKKKAKGICRGSLIGLLVYILFCWGQHDRAIKLAEAYAGSLKEEVIQIASLPQPASPFRWANYVETKDRIYQGFVDLLKRDSPHPISGSSILEKLSSLYWPPGNVRYQSFPKTVETPWVKRALATEGARFYYWFARFPVVRSVNSMDGRHRVEFMDVRFLLPGIRMPFVYHVEFNDSGRIVSEGFVEKPLIPNP